MYYDDRILEQELNTVCMGRSRRLFDTVDSTNLYLKEHREQLADGFAAVAAGQTGGRGSKGRSWESPPGTSLAFSVLCRPKKVFDYSILTLCAGLAVRRALKSITGLQTGIKWPNDILYEGKKLCGILCESVFDGQCPTLIIGIGVNMTATQDYFDEKGLPYATSLALCGVQVPKAERLAAHIINELELCCTAAERDGSLVSLQQELRQGCVTLGHEITARTPNGAYRAKAVDIDLQGRLIAENENGRQALSGSEVSVRGLYGYE